MNSSAGVAAVLARACRVRQGHLSDRWLRGTGGEFVACLFLYSDFANWTALLFFFIFLQNRLTQLPLPPEPRSRPSGPHHWPGWAETQWRCPHNEQGLAASVRVICLRGQRPPRIWHPGMSAWARRRRGGGQGSWGLP